jgi:hypothetical protein
MVTIKNKPTDTAVVMPLSNLKANEIDNMNVDKAKFLVDNPKLSLDEYIESYDNIQDVKNISQGKHHNYKNGDVVTMYNPFFNNKKKKKKKNNFIKGKKIKSTVKVKTNKSISDSLLVNGITYKDKVVHSPITIHKSDQYNSTDNDDSISDISIGGENDFHHNYSNYPDEYNELLTEIPSKKKKIITDIESDEDEYEDNTNEIIGDSEFIEVQIKPLDSKNKSVTDVHYKALFDTETSSIESTNIVSDDSYDSSEESKKKYESDKDNIQSNGEKVNGIADLSKFIYEDNGSEDIIINL